MIKSSHVIIVVSYNDINSTIDYIDNTYRFKNIDHIIIVDNCSTNGLSEEIKKHILKNNLDDKITCIKSERNGGYAYGNNFGIKYAIEKMNPRYISISNSDVILNEEAISECINVLDKDNMVGLVAPQMKTLREEPMKSGWKLPSYKDIIIDNLILLKPLINLKKYRNSISDFGNIDVISGSFYMGLTDTFKKINFLDEETFLYCEENILAYKLKSIGKYNVILNHVSYIHNHSESINNNISSVSKRLSILHDSIRIYNEKYLKINVIQKIIYEITYYIGKYTYLCAIKILRIKR